MVRTKFVIASLIGLGFSDLSGQNYIDQYLSGGLTYSTIATSANNVSMPTDLDFKPNTNELWLALRGNTVGANVIIYNAGLSNQTSQYRQDSNNGHFMAACSGLAFSDIGEWASSSESGHPTIPSAMGPSLWSSDTAIHARVCQNLSSGLLGSHLSMLHQSPFAMGIAHETGKTYWVFDGFNGDICKYDFVIHHSPGYTDHSAGKIWRYSFVNVTKVPGIPSHMVVDKVNNWLYFIDGGSKTVKRLKTTSGIISNTLTPPGSSWEPLAGYYSMAGALVETIETFTSQPCGIDYYNDRLVVSDYTNGNITLYNTTGASLVKLGTITTGQSGMMGIKIGTDGKIWFVNYTQNTVVRINPAGVLNDAAIENITAPSLCNYEPDFYSPQFNICGTSVFPTVRLLNNGTNALTSVNINYKIDNGAVNTFSWTGNLASGAGVPVNLPSLTVANGTHKLTVYTSIPNGNSDPNQANDKKDGSFRTVGLFTYPFFEGFSAAIFPPSGFDIIGFNKYAYMQRDATTGGFGVNTGCVLMNNYLSTYPQDKSGQMDYLMLPEVDLTSAPASAALEFNYAYAKSTFTNNENLKVKISTDCGNSWTTIYSKSGTVLSTAGMYPSTSFTPSASEWKKETISLASYIGQPALFLFVTTNGAGNNIYIDDININTPLGISEQKNSDLVSVYPNPSNGKIKIKGPVKNQMLSVYSVLGTEELKVYCGSEEFTETDLSQLSNGVYFLKVNGETVKKIIISK